VKTFALPVSAAGGDDRLMETRLLIHRASGWVGLPYLWQADGQDATLARTGKVIDTYVMVDGVQQDFRYQIPDVLTCRKCHQGRTDNEVMTPLGTTVRQLNHDFPYAGGAKNQLVYWQENGMLADAPAPASWPRAVDWHDTSEPLDLRVRSYLDTNCSHCHSDVGSGALSGLRLEMWRDPTDYIYGICNRAQGYYGGPLGLTYDIVPGNAADSVLPFRLGAQRHTDNAKDMMPPLGRSQADHDAVALVKRAVAHSHERRATSEPQAESAQRNAEIIGEAPAMQEVFRAIGRLSHSNIKKLAAPNVTSAPVPISINFECKCNALHHSVRGRWRTRSKSRITGNPSPPTMISRHMVPLTSTSP